MQNVTGPNKITLKGYGIQKHFWAIIFAIKYIDIAVSKSQLQIISYFCVTFLINYFEDVSIFSHF